eukprot:Skav200542  [mRNA]  locus=scaffold676:275833:284757:+ [translate_table: standard]
MLDWPSVANILAEEVLQRVTSISRDSFEGTLELPEKDWLRILQCLCVRLGWVSENQRSATQLSSEIFRALGVACPHRPAMLNLCEAFLVFQQLANAGKGEGNMMPPCPDTLVSESQRKIQLALRRRFLKTGMANSADFSRHAPPKRKSMSAVSSQLSQSQASLGGSASSSALVMDMSSPRASSEGPETSDDQRAQTQLVSLDNSPPVNLQGSLSIPQLPSNLDDLSASELRKFVVAHQADWVRAANRMGAATPATPTGSDAVAKAMVRKARRKALYWQKKSRNQKKDSEMKLHQLVQKTQLYVSSKRRKKTAFRNRLTVFSGYKLALARNAIGRTPDQEAESLVELNLDAIEAQDMDSKVYSQVMGRWRPPTDQEVLARGRGRGRGRGRSKQGRPKGSIAKLVVPPTLSDTGQGPVDEVENSSNDDAVKRMVARQELRWSLSSFIEATMVGQEQCIVSNLATVGRKRRGSKKTRQNQIFSSAASHENNENLEQEQDAESDSSLLDELGKLISEAEAGADSEEDDGVVDEQKKQFRNSQHKKITELSSNIAADSKYTNAAAPSGPPAIPASGGTGEIQENTRQMQNLEAAVGDHAVKQAIQSLSSDKANDLHPDRVTNCMKKAAESYNGLLTPEEEAEESLLELACQQDANPAVSSFGMSTEQDAQIWANQLGKMALAFQSFGEKFFDSREMTDSLFRRISLVHFFDNIDTGASSGSDAVASAGSTIQFVHWDIPGRYWGRRLRIERGRFVWRAPARLVNGESDDNLGHLFHSSRARVILHDCGAALVKATGCWRTPVPEQIHSVYTCLSSAAAVCDGTDEGDPGSCFVCKRLAVYLCPICQLYSHQECCIALASRLHDLNPQSYQSIGDTGELQASGSDGDHLPLNLCSVVASFYRDTCKDNDGSQLSSLSAFELAEQQDQPCKFPLPFRQTSCPLCKGVLTALEDAGSILFGPKA